jgi:hypothetical protein
MVDTFKSLSFGATRFGRANATGKSRRANYQGDGRRFTLSSEDRYHFRHDAVRLRGKFDSVNFRLCSRRRFTLTRQVASTRQAAFISG